MDVSKTGVYVIENLVNGKKYVGSAARSFKYRWNCHKNDLRNKRHHSHILQRAFNKYGEENFKFYILGYYPPCFVLKAEQHFIDAIKPEYNICKAAGSRIGVPNSQETREKVSKGLKKYFSIKENREIASKRAQEYYSNPENREKARQKSLEQYKDPKQIESLRERAIRQFSNPVAREKVRERSIKQFSDPAQREKNRDARSPFIYEILTPSGDIDIVFSARQYAKDKNIDAGRLLRTIFGTRACGRKCTHERGYKVLSKTPRQK